MSPSEFMSTVYPLVGVGVALVALVVGVVLVARQAEDAADTAVLIVLAAVMALMAGLAWPASIVLAAVWGLVMWIRGASDRRDEKRRAAERAKRYAPKPETDTQKFQRMAREQRDLAQKSRENGWDEIAAMQDNLAEQYEATAKMYAP